MLRSTLLCVPFVLVLAGCHKEDSGTNTAVVSTKPRETHVASGKEISAAGVSLTFPDSWKTIDLTKDQLDKGLSTLSQDARGSEMAKAARMVSQNNMVKFMVFDPEGSKPGFMNNVNLVVTPLPGPTTLDQALDASKQQLAALASQVSTSKTQLPAGEFGCIRAQMSGANGLKFSTLGFAQIHDREMDVITFTCSSDQAAEYETKAQSIMKTFKRT